ncbi:MAG TPA: ABC transporter permease [Vicinamibacterales bacterium]|nr:ABC transporter permease [Vicinamibacterales bacterium]
MSRTLQDVRFAARMLLKAPAFSVVAVLVLALGIGANTAMFTVVDALLFKPLAGRAGDLVGLYSHDRTKPDSYRAFSYPNYVDIRDRGGVFDALMAHTFAMVGVAAGDSTRQVFADVVSSNYFDTLGVGLAAGRPFSAAEERPGARLPVAIVGQDRAGLLGHTLKIDAIDFTVVGVVPQGFTGTMALISPGLWLPLGMYGAVVNDTFKNDGSGLENRANAGLIVAGRLPPGETTAAASARLEAVSRQLAEAYPADNHDQLLTISTLPRLSTSTSPQTDTGAGIGAAMLMAMAGVVLLIACLNIANMLMARGAGRRREIAIRIAVGGGRGRIVRQLLTEGLLLALAGAGAGLLLGNWATIALVHSFQAVLPLSVQFDARPDLTVLAATVGFAIAATMVFGLGPALQMSRGNVIADLKATAEGTAGRLGRWFTGRNLLVVGQIALSLMLLCAGGLFARGALQAAAATPGFSYDGQLLVQTDPALVQYDEAAGRAVYGRLLERVRATPGVASASLASSVPFGDFHDGRSLERVGGGVRPPVSGVYRIVGADYFRTLNLPMIRGREFTAAEETSAAAPRVAVIDERLAQKLFGAENPLGQMIRFADTPGAERRPDRNPMEVVGIAAPIRDELFDRLAGPAIYVPFGRRYQSAMSLHVRASRAATEAAVLDRVRRDVGAVDSRLPVLRATSLQDFHDRSLSLWMVQAGGRLFMTFGLLALALAVVGLYGVKSYLVSRRTREIGVRMALGARPGDVLRMVLTEGAALSAVGIAVGLPLAALMGKLLSSALYRVQPLDPFVFTVAPVLLAVAAMLATWVPARRATRVLPLSALREQ